MKTKTLLDQNIQYELIVFSHLRWDFVYQRPQHIISRLAQKYRILFVEEPISTNGNEPYQLRSINNSITIFQPCTNSIAHVPAVVSNFLNTTQLPMAWFYSPAFIDILNRIKFDTVIYDCMDELSLFKGASEQLKEQEQILLQNADIVFTGGRSLYEAKSKLHKHVYCFPSSVDIAHFRQAINNIEIPADGHFKQPVIGYCGVIDERIDYNLLNTVANTMKDVAFVILGPIVKVNENELPKLDNIHYLGMKPYSMLPNYLKGFDIAMMPFALNPATKYISPTKTLEYMAACKPIISTPIFDVIRDYGTCIEIVANTEGFCYLARNILNRTGELACNMTRNYQQILSRTSWDNTVASMDRIIQKHKKHEQTI